MSEHREEQVMVRVNSTERQWLAALSERFGISRPEVVRQLIRREYGQPTMLVPDVK